MHRARTRRSCADERRAVIAIAPPAASATAASSNGRGESPVCAVDRAESSLLPESVVPGVDAGVGVGVGVGGGVGCGCCCIRRGKVPGIRRGEARGCQRVAIRLCGGRFRCTFCGTRGMIDHERLSRRAGTFGFGLRNGCGVVGYRRCISGFRFRSVCRIGRGGYRTEPDYQRQTEDDAPCPAKCRCDPAAHSKVPLGPRSGHTPSAYLEPSSKIFCLLCPNAAIRSATFS